jgi:hypothetical protein
MVRLAICCSNNVRITLGANSKRSQARELRERESGEEESNSNARLIQRQSNLFPKVWFQRTYSQRRLSLFQPFPSLK